MNTNPPFLLSLGDRHYRNPLPVDYAKDEQKGLDVPSTHPDPYVLAYKGEYYCYSTGHHGVTVLHSRDLSQWESRGYALTSPEKGYWAPCVIYHNGKFYMYYSSGVTADHFQYMKVAVSDSPFGPFEPKKTLFDYFSIDAHVVQDEDGTHYLFYSVDNYAGTDEEKPGTVILVDRLIDLYTPEGKPRLAVGPTIPQELSAPNRFGDGRDWYTIEGAFYLKRGGRHYLMYSGNSFEHEDYFVGTAMDGTAASIGQCDFVKYPGAGEYAPLLRKNDIVEGPGHHSAATSPNLVEDWVFYHGRDIEETPSSEERRQLRMDPLLWANERLWVPGPTWDDRDAPGLPDFRELCDVEGSPDQDRWERVFGEWLLKDGSLLQDKPEGFGLLRQRAVWADWRGEVWLRGFKHMTGGRYGIYIEADSDDCSLLAYIDAGRKELVVVATDGGIESVVSRVAFPSAFDPYAWHQVRVDKRGSAVSVSVDGLVYYEGVLSSAFGSCKLGLATLQSRAAFGGIAVTSHYETRFDNSAELSGRWKAKNGTAKISREGANIVAGKGGEIELAWLPRLPDSFVAQWDWDMILLGREGTAGVTCLKESEEEGWSLLAEPNEGGLRVSLRDIASGETLASVTLTERRVSVYARTSQRGYEIRVNGLLLHAGTGETGGFRRLSFSAKSAEARLRFFRLTGNYQR